MGKAAARQSYGSFESWHANATLMSKSPIDCNPAVWAVHLLRGANSKSCFRNTFPVLYSMFGCVDVEEVEYGSLSCCVCVVVIQYSAQSRLSDNNRSMIM